MTFPLYSGDTLMMGTPSLGQNIRATGVPDRVSGSYHHRQWTTTRSDSLVVDGTYRVCLDYIPSLDPFDLLFFNDQVRAEETACNFAAVEAVTDMATTLAAEEVVVLDFDVDCFAETSTFHCVACAWSLCVSC